MIARFRTVRLSSREQPCELGAKDYPQFVPRLRVFCEASETSIACDLYSLIVVSEVNLLTIDFAGATLRLYYDCERFSERVGPYEGLSAIYTPVYFEHFP